MRIFCIIILSCLFAVNLQAQNFVEAFKDGGKYFKHARYDEAIEKFNEALKYNNRSDKAWFYLAMSFKRNDQPEQASIAFEKLRAVNPDYNPAQYFEGGEVFIELNRLSRAERYYEKFLADYPDIPNNTLKRHEAKNRLVYAQKSNEVREQPNATSEPELVSQLNSNSNDYAPQVNPMGTRLYFTSVRQGGFDNVQDSSRANHYGEDIYVSNLKNGAWSTPIMLPEPINSINDDFGSAFTGDGQTMVYVRCGGEESVGNCDLYITTLDGTKWSEPVNMGNVVNSKDWESQPTISSDGTRIIFTSSRDGGYGGADLYMTELNHLGDWGIPQNLGSTINTPLSDNSPFLAADGKTLYYATSGHPGHGGVDIFYSVFENGKWATPINLGAPINSSGEDKNFSISGSGDAYFSSSRVGDSYNIYKTDLPDYLKPKPTAVIEGIVANANTEEPLGALVMIEDIDTGELIAINKSNSESGEYLVVLPAGRNYSVSASRDGYFFYSQSFDLPKDTTYQEITKNINLEPIEKGTKVVLNNIFFESGRAELKPISYVELNKAVELMQQNGTMVIEVGGHTDNLGSEEANQRLSQARADAVVKYLKLAGVEEARLQAKGYGESVPLEDNSTAEGRKANRRTEFVIVEF
ncbi:WD40-like Beta Propeller Repeat [Reichenbachiella faecimaris]|uniref:WD40-like Beta Propeller Repeat n=1 Tax=Reichenbachiella faecimaris TaxID=692418 RepID=A0A1W2G4Y9_REIFA|nr:OmpA family protein [Reichenbachiella faecimaris]SMD31735.1 WD40-like Beta Propeller Repeat [Reichenbachiella faecimaris]